MKTATRTIDPASLRIARTTGAEIPAGGPGGVFARGEGEVLLKRDGFLVSTGETVQLHNPWSTAIPAGTLVGFEPCRTGGVVWVAEC